MNIKLSTGLEFFWQWDVNLKLKVPDGIPEVHFRFGNKSKAYEVKSGWVNVPNELLQKVDDIECWFYDTGHTIDFGRIEGRRRPKPDGYIYEETEFKSYEDLNEKIKEALAGVKNADAQLSLLADKLDKTNEALEKIKEQGTGAQTPATKDTLGLVIVGDNLNITKEGVLSVNVATKAEQDNTQPISSAAVNTLVGDINALLQLI